METIWKERPPVLDDGLKRQAVQISEDCGIPYTIACMAVKRGCEDSEAAMAYLDPSPEDFHNPFGLPDMEAAVKRLVAARDGEELVCIYGDYDVDGTTAVSMLMKYFKAVGIRAIFRIPNRLKEGYGMNLPAVEALVEKGVNLIVTVDNGIAAAKEIAYCVSKGVDVIVTDHHECQEALPGALAVIDAKRPDSHYPFAELCGAGIAFKIIQALDQYLGRGDDLTEYMECAALATVADIVPLKDENRVLVSLGIQSMNEGPVNPGIGGLIEVSGIDCVTAGRIGFVLAPKINAAGRLGEADRVVSLYTSDDGAVIEETARFLKEENEKRQEIEGEITDEVIAQIQGQGKYKEVFIVAAGRGWHSGVIGIVASKIQEKWYHPVIVIGIGEDGLARGSCRSVSGINMFEALSSCQELFENYGGHAQAAGFSIREENIPKLEEALKAWSQANQVEDCLKKTLYYDMEMDLDALDESLMEGLVMCEPYGVGNPGPVFHYGKQIPDNVRKMGRDGAHLSFSVENTRCVGFQWGSRMEEVSSGEISLLATPKNNTFRDETHIELNLVDLKRDELNDYAACWKIIARVEKGDGSVADAPVWHRGEAELLPDREAQVAVYRMIKKAAEKPLPFDQVCKSIENMNGFKLIVCLKVMKEVGVIGFKLKKGILFSHICKTNEKKDIQNAPLMIELRKYILKG